MLNIKNKYILSLVVCFFALPLLCCSISNAVAETRTGKTSTGEDYSVEKYNEALDKVYEADKAYEKAEKAYKKIKEKCEKKPEKCDNEALEKAANTLSTAAKTKSQAAKEWQDSMEVVLATKDEIDGYTEQGARTASPTTENTEENSSSTDGNPSSTTEQNNFQDNFLDSFEEEEPNEAEIQAYNCKDSTTGESCTLTAANAETCKCDYKEVYTDENGNTKEGKIGTFDDLDENGNPLAMQRCYEARNDVFQYIACKAMTTLADVRVIVYTLAGFGLIAFAFAAIFNKISWKHLANLCIALFILSMMTPFIEYFTQDNGGTLTYGNYLPAGFTNIDGSDVDAVANCDTSKGDVCPDVNVDTSAKDSKWSWKDLKNTVKNGINAAKTAYDTYKTVKNTVDTTIDQAKKIGTAIRNSEGGLTGVLDTLGEVATASDTIFNTVKTGAGAVVNNTASIAMDVQNAGKSSTELAFDKENQARIDELEKKLAAGNLTPQEQEWAKAELEQRKAAVDQNKVADYANTKGQQALNTLGNIAKTASTASNIVTTASNAAQQGATIGGGAGTAVGDTLGALFGLGTAVGEGISAVDDAKQAKIDAANAEKAAAEKAAEEARRKEETRKNNASYSQGKQWDNSFNAGMETKTPSAPQIVSSSNNNKQEVPDEPYAANMTNMQKENCEKRGGFWNSGTNSCAEPSKASVSEKEKACKEKNGVWDPINNSCKVPEIEKVDADKNDPDVHKKVQEAIEKCRQSCEDTYMTTTDILGNKKTNLDPNAQRKYQECTSKCTADNVVN